MTLQFRWNTILLFSPLLLRRHNQAMMEANGNLNNKYPSVRYIFKYPCHEELAVVAAQPELLLRERSHGRRTARQIGYPPTRACGNVTTGKYPMH